MIYVIVAELQLIKVFKMAQLNISKKATNQLTDLSVKRKNDDDVVRTKKGIAEDLIDRAHKKECKP